MTTQPPTYFQTAPKQTLTIQLPTKILSILHLLASESKGISLDEMLFVMIERGMESLATEAFGYLPPRLTENITP